MHVIFVVSAPPSCYYGRQHVIIVVSAPTACYSRCQRANIMLLCVLSASASPCIMLLWSSSRQNACLMLLSSAIANDTISHHTEFMQKHIHHDDDDDARVIGASTSSIIARSGRAPRPRSGCCGRTASSKCPRRQHLSRRHMGPAPLGRTPQRRRYCRYILIPGKTVTNLLTATHFLGRANFVSAPSS
jgi:hypothetical protein